MKNAVYTFFSNLVAMCVTALVTLIAPKMLTVEEYSWFQLYLFYVTYISIFSLGWGEGIYLRHGGEYLEKLDKKAFSGQFRFYMLIEIVFAIMLVLASGAFIEERQTIVFFWGIAIAAYAPCLFYRNLLLSVNCIKEYAITHIIEKGVYCVVGLTAIFVFRHGFYFLLIADIVGKIAADLYIFILCRSLIFARTSFSTSVLKTAWENIRVGSKLMISNLISLFIIGVVRFFIERTWDTTTFGKVSLTISISNLLMVFIRAVALVMFPMLRRTNSDKLSGIYNTMRTCLMIPLLGMLVCYYPAKVILSAWLPQYADSLIYMALLFPMCVFESKMSMLIETYMKTLRKEKWLLLVNVTTVSLSVVITLITTYWLHNLDLAVASIVFLLAFRCVFAELLLSTVLDVNVKTDIVLELALTIIFIGASWFVGGIAGLAIYAVAYLVYLFIKRNDVAFVLNTALRMVRRV